MSSNKNLTPGLEADMAGNPCPPMLRRWLGTLPNDLLTVLQTLANDGAGAWLVGGCVRDAWLGDPSSDIDVCTTCPPDRMLTLFGEKAIPTGVDYGTVTVKGEGRHYEVTTLRTESMYRDGRRPEHVQWGSSLREDLSRRDFTFNSMAVDVARQLLYDPFQGAIDLRHRTVRAVGDARLRCEEDALRILRAYRFLRRDDGALWRMEPSLASAVSEHGLRLTLVAIERRWMEMRKILEGDRPGEILGRMQEQGVLRHVFEDMTVFNEALFKLLDEDELNGLLLHQRLALLTIEHPTKEVVHQLQRLRTSRELQRKTAVFHEQLGHLPTDVASEMRVFHHVMRKDAGAHLSIQKAMHNRAVNVHTGLKVGGHEIDALLGLWQDLKDGEGHRTCLVDGHWIMARTGDIEGVRLGRLKQWLHRIQIEEGINEPAAMEAVLSRLPYEHGAHEDWPQPVFP